MQGNGDYDGKGGNDAIYVDWSSATSAITINNSDLVTVQDFNGSTVKNIERWLVKTGSGDDVISTANYDYNDEIDSGAGNDTISTGGGNDVIDSGSGDDSIDAGSGGGSIQAGAGNDTIAVQANWGERDVVSGGTGTDSLSIDFSANSSAPLSWYGVNASGITTSSVNFGSSLTEIQAALNNAVKFFVGYYYNSNNSYGVTFEGIENLSLIASDRGL